MTLNIIQVHILFIFYKENRHIKFLFSEAHPGSLLKANINCEYLFNRIHFKLSSNISDLKS